MTMSMADSNDQSRLMESLRAYESIGSLNLPFLDEQSSAGRDFDIQLNEMLQVNGTPQNDGMLDAGPLEQLPQLPYHPSEIQQNNGMLDAPPLEQLSQFSKFSSHPNQKPKQNIDLDWPMDNVSEASSTMSRTTAIVVYDGKGHKRGGSFTKNLKNVNNGEPGGSSRTQFREADMERARLILPLLSGTIAILRYGCGCRSPRGTCNHNTFIAGLALPDGIVCANCQAGATEKVSRIPQTSPPSHTSHLNPPLITSSLSAFF